MADNDFAYRQEAAANKSGSAACAMPARNT